ncbi:hypothetical protein M885DRAFT_627219, partial [Pelagophyceae sp. CCMP2097]
MALLCRVKVCVRPGTGDLKSKSMTVDGASSFIGIFEKIVGELSEDLAPRVGDLQRVTLTLGAEEAEPEESSDPVGKYFDMGLKVITFVGHLEAMKPVNDLLLERFTQLSLKGRPFQRGPEVSEADADTFFNSKIDNFFTKAAPEGLRRRGVTRALLNTTRAAAFIETHVTGDPYKYEHEGALPPDDVKELYASYKCEYGCAPPVAPPEMFLAMGRELPRPRKNGAGKYDEFKDCFGQPTPLQLPELKAAPKEVVSPAILQKEKLRDVVKCSECGRRRGVYVSADPGRAKVLGGRLVATILPDVVIANRDYDCGEDLDLTQFPELEGGNRPYVRTAITCASPMELQVYSSKVLGSAAASTCGYCGDAGALKVVGSETTILLPVCGPCKKRHSKARSSGAPNPKFDTGSRRAAVTAAATRRSAEIEAAEKKGGSCAIRRGAKMSGPASKPTAPAAEDINLDGAAKPAARAAKSTAPSGDTARQTATAQKGPTAPPLVAEPRDDDAPMSPENLRTMAKAAAAGSVAPRTAAASKRGQAFDFLDAESAAPSGDEFVAASMAAAPKRQREAKPLAPMSDEDRKLWEDFSWVKEYDPDFSRRLREAAALEQQTQHVRDGGLMDLGGDSEDDEAAAATAVQEYLYATMAHTKAAP